MEELKNSFTRSLKLAIDEVNGQISITIFWFKIFGRKIVDFCNCSPDTSRSF